MRYLLPSRFAHAYAYEIVRVHGARVSFLYIYAYAYNLHVLSSIHTCRK